MQSTSSSLSYTKIHDVLMRSSALSMNAKAVLSLLHDMGHRSGRCNPRQKTLAKMLGLSRNTIVRAIAELKRLKLTTVVKGQRGCRYKVAPIGNWKKILLHQNATAELVSAAPKCDSVQPQNGAAEPPLPYMNPSIEPNISSSSTRENQTNGGRAAQTAIARRPPVVESQDQPSVIPNICALLLRLEDIYRQAGAPIPPRHKQLAFQLIMSLTPAETARVEKRLPEYCMWAIATGKWSDASKTKSLLNVLRDGDWDVELTTRKVPLVKHETSAERVLREAEERFLARRSHAGS